MDLVVSALLFALITMAVYWRVGFSNISKSYGLWFKEGYWVKYNIVEAASWLAKAGSFILLR